jgi:bifunctional enzyme CysN/CysC
MADGASKAETGGVLQRLDEQKRLLRVLACGSVDDGKSTLIGRLLYDNQLVLDDQISALASDSRRFGQGEANIDFSLLLDGLQAEREQRITIDVAYRYFATPRRAFIVADTPGHEQYTRNMATGASTSDLAIVLTDARKGILEQTRRHTFIAHLLGIRYFVLAINKMDLVGWEEQRFREIADAYIAFVARLGTANIACIPVSARLGDNVVDTSGHMPWYTGPTLIDHLEAVNVECEADQHSLRMPVQWVNRANADFRGYAGTLVAGCVAVGDTVVVLPSGRSSTVRRIVTYGGDLRHAEKGDAVTLLIADEIDISRGDVLTAASNLPQIADQFAAHVIWMSDEPMLPGRPYLLKCGTQTVAASISTLKHKISVEDFTEIASRTLELNEIGMCNVSLAHPIAYEPYENCRALGSFILIDKFTNATVAAGLIRFALRRAHNIQWQTFDVTRAARARAKGQKPCCLWFTGLSGSGKSTIANRLEQRLFALGQHTYILDGDNVRHGLNRDLGFTDADRVENIRRVAEVARLMADAGLIVLVSFISPFRAEREFARSIFPEGEFMEIHLDTPIDVCERRDPKGLYKKARAGLLENFTGIDSPYETPAQPELRLDSSRELPDQLVEEILDALRRKGIITD